MHKLSVLTAGILFALAIYFFMRGQVVKSLEQYAAYEMYTPTRSPSRRIVRRVVNGAMIDPTDEPTFLPSAKPFCPRTIGTEMALADGSLPGISHNAFPYMALENAQ